MASAHIYDLPADAVWFITGSSSGIGKALARQIASHPTNRLVATARNVSKLAEFLSPSERVHIIDLDVTLDNAIDAAVGSALSRFGRIDVVVNNAGYGLMGDTESALQPEGQAKARKQIETNLWGTTRLSLHAVRVFRDENPKSGRQGGVVLNVTSLGGFAGFPGTAFYHAAKFGVEGFTEGISKEVRPEWNIHFCLIEPGGTSTNFAASDSMDWFEPHPAYAAADSPTRILEGYVKNPDMQKTWTPADRVANAMYQVVALAKFKPIPIRLPLTAGAWNVVKNEVAAVDKELEDVKALSLSVEIDDANKAGQFLMDNYRSG
ncbi:retinol dehydrogenase 8 [Xylaria bambusicola]|uniref:retinol dehydrogenase 8 n=1 Tax=Xylaria bambusicola TaxID=326684 RepID=UPI002008E7B6|nr:retinol dehydrogenase 8 [Xylaria bambusicola]KAI0525848.1 retinol dehydrogenase 8 [Xylaria bambusicola]